MKNLLTISLFSIILVTSVSCMIPDHKEPTVRQDNASKSEITLLQECETKLTEAIRQKSSDNVQIALEHAKQNFKAEQLKNLMTQIFTQALISGCSLPILQLLHEKGAKFNRVDDLKDPAIQHVILNETYEEEERSKIVEWLILQEAVHFAGGRHASWEQTVLEDKRITTVVTNLQTQARDLYDPNIYNPDAEALLTNRLILIQKIPALFVKAIKQHMANRTSKS